MQALEKIAYSNNWITGVLLVILVCVVLLKAMDANRFKRSAFSLFNINFIENESDNKTVFFDVFKIIIFLCFLLVFSLVTFKFNEYYLSSVTEDFSLFLSVFLSLSSYFLIKRGFEHVFSLLFLIKNEVRFFIISKYNFLYTISLLLYIAIVLCEYVNLKQVYLFYFAGFLFVLRFVFIIITNKKLIFSKLFYFILYFCAFEIAPLFVLFKLMF